MVEQIKKKGKQTSSTWDKPKDICRELETHPEMRSKLKLQVYKGNG